MVLGASMTAFTACDDDEDEGGQIPPAPSVLSGTVTSDLLLEAGKSYTLDGALQVKAPATLKIEEGVTITANNDGQVDYILIEKGAKIDAQGTAERPIVMTAEAKKEGAWGGLHICGNAPTNSGSGVSEIGNAAYGGNDVNDNSGVLKYVRMEYTGFEFDSEHESNGISFYGVGNGTQVSYVQAYVGSDDGLEFFGGTVNIDDLKENQTVGGTAGQEIETDVFTVAEQMPIFPGGEAALLRYVSEHTKYPSIALEQEIQGVVTIRFVVTPTGAVGDVFVVQGLDPECDREAVRVVKSLPRFTPGKQQGKPVAVWYTLPVRFEIR